MTTLIPTPQRTRLPLTLDSNAADKSIAEAAKVSVAAAGAPESGNSVEDWIAHFAAGGSGGVIYYADALPPASDFQPNQLVYLAGGETPGFYRAVSGGFVFNAGFSSAAGWNEWGVYLSHQQGTSDFNTFGSAQANLDENVNYCAFAQTQSTTPRMDTSVDVRVAAWEAVKGSAISADDTFYMTITRENGDSRRAQFAHHGTDQPGSYTAANGHVYRPFSDPAGRTLNGIPRGEKFSLSFEKDDGTPFWLSDHHWMLVNQHYALQSLVNDADAALDAKIAAITNRVRWVNAGNIAGAGVDTEVDISTAHTMNIWHLHGGVLRSYSVSPEAVREGGDFEGVFPATMLIDIGNSTTLRLGWETPTDHLWIGPSSASGTLSLAAGEIEIEVLG